MKKKIIYTFLFLSFLGFTNSSYSQFSRKGIPYSIERGASSVVNTYAMPTIDNSDLQIQAAALEDNCSDCKNKYYGKGIDVDIDVKTAGQLEILGDNSKLWLLKITSLTSYGMQFYFNKFNIPFGATLYIYNEEKSSLLGAFTRDNNNLDQTKPIQFGTQWIDGNSIIIEYHEPYNPEFEGEIKIKTVVHIFKDVFNKSGPFGESGECNRNVSCPEGSGWEKEINSVALILAYDPFSQLHAQCSGALINNTSQDREPYFLSANHCIDVAYPADPCYDPSNPYDPANDYLFDYSNWLFLFNHQSTSCSSDGSEISISTVQSVYGSTLLASDGNCSPNSDYLLLKLNTTKEILESYGACYSGWTNENGFGTPPFVGIHHPSGDIKKISFAGTLLTSTEYGATSVNTSFSHWKVEDWDTGVTEGGSSGSPLFNSNHQIVGQLHGGASGCIGSIDNAESDWYGKFSTSWQLGNFSNWLDQSNTGLTNINSYCATSCYDGIQNGTETGIDCGGNCTPCYSGGSGSVCYTVEHTINNHSTLGGDFLNVCKDNIIIRPYSYTNCINIALWNVTKSELQTSNHVPCVSAGTPPGQPMDCYTDMTPIPLILLPDLSCICKYEKLFISVQECDENKNLIGTEYTHWIDCYPVSTSTFKDFVLNNYLPSGASIQEGKLYKIKTATVTGGWKEYTSFIKIYADNLVVIDNNILHDQFANILTMQNSNVPSTSDVKIVAKTQINIQQETILSSGRYYIENFDCTTLDQFRGMENGNTHNENTSFSEKKHNLSNKRELDNIVKNTFNKSEEILIYPNPTSNNLTIESQKQIKELFIYNSIGTIVLNETSISSNKLNIDLSQQSKGIYLIKIVDSTNKLTNKKIIKN